MLHGAGVAGAATIEADADDPVGSEFARRLGPQPDRADAVLVGGAVEDHRRCRRVGRHTPLGRDGRSDREEFGCSREAQSLDDVPSVDGPIHDGGGAEIECRTGVLVAEGRGHPVGDPVDVAERERTTKSGGSRNDS